MLKKLALAASLSAALVAPTAHAATFTYNGTTEGGAVFNRPVEDFSALSGVGTDTNFSVLAFKVDVSGDYSFVTTTAFDAVTLLYGGSFAPGAPLDHGLVGNDDLQSSTTSGFAYGLTAGTTYYHVTTSFFSGDTGAYSLTISGPGAVAAVPEPAAWALSLVGLLGIGAYRRHSQRRVADPA